MSTILAVDDSASMRQMVAVTLRAVGYHVIEAVDGEDALNKAKAAPVSLVLTDLYMPALDGISLIRELRKLPSFRLTPILTLTTESSVEKKAEAKAAGATGWLVKPFNPEQLLATIKIVLD